MISAASFMSSLSHLLNLQAQLYSLMGLLPTLNVTDQILLAISNRTRPTPNTFSVLISFPALHSLINQEMYVHNHKSILLIFSSETAATTFWHITYDLPPFLFLGISQFFSYSPPHRSLRTYALYIRTIVVFYLFFSFLFFGLQLHVSLDSPNQTSISLGSVVFLLIFVTRLWFMWNYRI